MLNEPFYWAGQTGGAEMLPQTPRVDRVEQLR